MIDIPVEEQTKYKNNEGNKVITLEFYKDYASAYDDDIEPAHTLSNENIISESMELNEGISTEQNIRYGQCFSSKFKIEIFDLIKGLGSDVDFVGYVLKVFIHIEKEKESDIIKIPLFIGRIAESKLQDNRNNRIITAYDILSEKLNTDMTDLFWDDLVQSRTFKYIRNKILTTLDIPFDDVSLVSDEKEFFSIEWKDNHNIKITARKALESILEMYGCFGHINRYGKFKFIFLKDIVYWYPAKANDPIVRYPANPNNPNNPPGTIISYPGSIRVDSNISNVDIGKEYINLHYGEFKTNNITGVEFIQKNDVLIDSYKIPKEDVTQQNIYVSKTNVFIEQQESPGVSELEPLSNYFSSNLLSEIEDNIYTPYNLECAGLPYVEVGDYINFKPMNDDKKENTINAPIFIRTLKGIQALMDIYEAKGTEDRRLTL